MIFYMQECEEKLGYSFKDKAILRQCFTHSSYSHEHGNGKNNERLEFFGDSILGFLTAEYLVSKYPSADEGALTEFKQQLVSRKPLAAAIKRAGLGDFLLYGEGESRNSPENHEAAHENLFEALVAGIYIDGGIEPTRKFVKNFLFSKTSLKESGEIKSTKNSKTAGVTPSDSKSLLQIFAQKQKLGNIEYKSVKVSGPPHNPTFEMEVSVGGKVYGRANGKTKSEASKGAAEIAYAKLTAEIKTVKDKSKTNGGKRRKNK